jgi:protease I
MANQDLSTLKVAILVTDGFEQVEMTQPQQALKQAGAETHIVSPKPDRRSGLESF